jgi:ABC-type antimicrobial peptide transport system permease subunit
MKLSHNPHIRKFCGILSFGLAVWLILKTILILCALFSLRPNHDSRPHFLITNFAGLWLEGWQIYALAIFFTLAAALFICLGIYAFSCKKSDE